MGTPTLRGRANIRFGKVSKKKYKVHKAENILGCKCGRGGGGGGALLPRSATDPAYIFLIELTLAKKKRDSLCCYLVG